MRVSNVPRGRLDSKGAARCKQVGANVIQSVCSKGVTAVLEAGGGLFSQEDQGKVGL